MVALIRNKKCELSPAAAIQHEESLNSVIPSTSRTGNFNVFTKFFYRNSRMLRAHNHRYSPFIFAIILLLTATDLAAQAQKLNLKWNSRDDLNILLPASIRIFETNGVLQDGAHVRAMYATVDLRDKNLKLHAVGNNTLRETTLDAYKRNHAILAINGGYF